MLKFEKKGKRGDVGISLREAGRLLTPTFTLALGASFAIHLAGALLFHVSPFTLGQTETIFPPVQVRIDYQPLIDGNVLAELDHETQAAPPVPAPALSRPLFPSIKTVGVNYHAVKIDSFAKPDYPFENVEHRLFAADIASLSPIEQENQETCSIRITGALHGRKYSVPDLIEPETGGSVPCIAAYMIKVDDRSGKVIWASPIDPPERKRMQSFAEKVLAAMTFEKNPKGFISEGALEIELCLPEREAPL